VLSPKKWLLKGADRVLPLVGKVPFVVQRLALQQALNRCLAEPLRDGLRYCATAGCVFGCLI
jgi:predicted lipid carrier protein YhbT